jgi:hypothetical protein
MILVSNEQSGHYLMHYRTKGSKNGVRLYQNEDGSLTPLGREHYGIGEGRKGGESSDDSGSESEPKKPSFRERIKEKRHAQKIDREAHLELRKSVDSEKKNIRNLTDTELQDRINRLNKEKQLSQLLDESVNRDVSPLRQKAEKIISDAAEDLAKKTLSTVTQNIVDKLSKKLKEDKPFKLDKYRDADLLKLKSDEIAKIVTAFDQVGRIAENRAKALKKPDTSTKEESKSDSKSESKPASESSSTTERTIGKNTKKKIRRMKGEGKSAAEIASALGLTEESVKPFM